MDGDDSANNQKWPDVISIHEEAGNARVLYSYEGEGPAILSNQYGAGKIIFLAFGFEGINGEDVRHAVWKDLLREIKATPSETLERMKWAYHSNPHAYQAMIQNFKLTDENRKEVESYLNAKANKAPFRTILKSLMK